MTENDRRTAEEVVRGSWPTWGAPTKTNIIRAIEAQDPKGGAA